MEGDLGLAQLPDDVLTAVFSFLRADDVVACSRTCRRLRRAALAEPVWMSLCARSFGERLGSLRAWPTVASYRELFIFLRKFACLEGDWYGAVYPRGQMLMIRGEEGAFVARRVAVALTDANEEIPLAERGTVSRHEVFRIVPQGPPHRAEGGRGLVHWHPRPHAGIGPQGSEGGPLQMIPDYVKYAMSAAENAIRICSSTSSFELTRPEEGDVGDDLSLTEDEIRLRYHLYIRRGLLPVEKLQKLTTYHRLETVQRRPFQGTHGFGLSSSPTSVMVRLQDEDEVDADDADDDDIDLSGLWWGTFGPHGPELVQVTCENMHYVGRKITGDPNVPSGQITFRVSAAAEMEDDIPPSTLEVLQSMFNNLNTRVTCVHRGAARIAETGFSSAEWTLGLMLRYANGDFGMLFFPEGFIINFTRLALPALS